MTISAVGSAWNPNLLPRFDGAWSTYTTGNGGAGAAQEPSPDIVSASGSVLAAITGSGAAQELQDSASGGNTAGPTWTISASAGDKGNLQIYENFESLAIQQYPADTIPIGQLIGSWGLGLSISTTRSFDGTRSLRSDFSAGTSGSGIDFPKVYRPLSAAQPRAYMACRLWIEGNGTVHIYKFARIGSGTDVYGGHPHAGASYNPSFDVNSFGGEMIDGNDVTVGYGANNTANANNFALAFVKNQWLFYEAELYCGTLNNADAVYLERVNGIPTTIWNNKTYLTSANSQLSSWFITPFNGWDIATDNRGYLDNVYIDESRARVILTDNIVYSSSTKWEIQPIISGGWSYNSGTGVTTITAAKRGGASFTTGNVCALHTFSDAGVLVKSESRTF